MLGFQWFWFEGSGNLRTMNPWNLSNPWNPSNLTSQ